MRYISESNISFSLNVKGNDRRFRFSPCMDGGSIYVTDDASEIQALEGSDMYDRVYRRHPSCVDEEVKVDAGKKSGKKKSTKKEEELKEVAEVSNWQEAKEYLVSNCGVKEDSVCNPSEIAEAARNNNISFPNLEQ